MTAEDLKLGVACPTRHLLGMMPGRELGGEANVSIRTALAATLHRRVRPSACLLATKHTYARSVVRARA